MKTKGGIVLARPQGLCDAYFHQSLPHRFVTIFDVKIGFQSWFWWKQVKSLLHFVFILGARQESIVLFYLPATCCVFIVRKSCSRADFREKGHYRCLWQLLFFQSTKLFSDTDIWWSSHRLKKAKHNPQKRKTQGTRGLKQLLKLVWKIRFHAFASCQVTGSFWGQEQQRNGYLCWDVVMIAFSVVCRALARQSIASWGGWVLA